MAKNKGRTIPSDYIKVDELSQKMKLLLYIFGKFHSICEENGLRYNLFGGTFLGAIRHKGMIPWDDDIDVTMPRPDYEKLRNIVNEKYGDKFHVHHYSEGNYGYPYLKFILKDSILIEPVREKYKYLGAYVDVFPADGYPVKNEKGFFRKLKFNKKFREFVTVPLKRRKSFKNKLKNLVKCLSIPFARMHSAEYYAKKEDKLLLQNDYDNAEYLLCHAAGWFSKGKIKKSVYENRKLYDFDGIKAWGIVEYDEHLTSLYGDYMTPPKVEDRVLPHGYELYVKNETMEQINCKDGGEK